MGRMGMYPDLPRMPVVVGYEVGGRIDAVGPEVTPDWIGADVLALTRFGGYSDVVCVPEAQVFVRPDGMDVAQGAALPVNYLTAWQLVRVMGSLHAGETMLVHSAGGGVGIAAIQIAKRLGAHVIGTASAGKHERLHKLGVDHCIDYTREDFEARVREITAGRGVELILDAVGGDSFKKSFRALAPTGRLGMFGLSAAATGKQRSWLGFAKAAARMPWFQFTPLTLMNDNKCVFGVNVGHLWGEIDRITGWMEELLRLYREGVVKPVVAASFSFAEAPKAHHYIQDRKNFGKVLLTP
jgi:NADPH:quinone reductase-like Zn-dependent oxidoreductase